VPLQQGTWVLPEGEGFDAGLTQVIATISDAGGQPVVLRVADDDIGTVSLKDLFTAQREAEWGEFLRECGKYEAELDDEVAKGKLTLAELDEEEESLERLRRWYRAIRARDAYGAPSASQAERRLTECADALEHFAELVYQARERP
jgi:hypothetical protein